MKTEKSSFYLKHNVISGLIAISIGLAIVGAAYAAHLFTS